MSIAIALSILTALVLLWMRAIDRERDAEVALQKRIAEREEFERIEAAEAVAAWERNYHREINRIKARQYHDDYMADIGAQRIRRRFRP